MLSKRPAGTESSMLFPKSLKRRGSQSTLYTCLVHAVHCDILEKLENISYLVGTKQVAFTVDIVQPRCRRRLRD